MHCIRTCGIHANLHAWGYLHGYIHDHSLLLSYNYFMYGFLAKITKL